MTSDPDKLFRDKLRNVKQPAPPSAWGRIERNVARPPLYKQWGKMAATIFVLVVTCSLLWALGPLRLLLSDPSLGPLRLTLSDPRNIKSEQKETLDDRSLQPLRLTLSDPRNINSVQKETLSDPQNINSDQKETLSDPRNINSEEEGMLDAHSRKLALSDQQNISNEQDDMSGDQRDLEKHENEQHYRIELPETHIVGNTPQTEGSETNVKVIPESEALPEITKKPKKILYQVEDVNARFLVKNVKPGKPVDITSKAVNQNTSFVYVIKNNEYGLGDLRQIKNELLTLDFLAHNDKNDKSKNR